MHLVRFSSALVAFAFILIGLSACGGGNDEGTTSAASGEAVAVEGLPASLPARLEQVSLRLRQRGFVVNATTPHPQTPRSLWPTGSLRVETAHGPLTIYAYRSRRVVREVLNPARTDPRVALRGYRGWWSSGRAADDLGGCGRYLYYGRNANNGRASRVADLCHGLRTRVIVVE